MSTQKKTLDSWKNLSIYFKTYLTIKFWHTFIHCTYYECTLYTSTTLVKTSSAPLLHLSFSFALQIPVSMAQHASSKIYECYRWAHFYIHYLLYSLSLTHALEKAKSLTTIRKNCREWPVGGLDVMIFDKFSPSWNYWTIIFATRRSKHSEHYFQRDLINLRIWWWQNFGQVWH
jgi:hypothetical protein